MTVEKLVDWDEDVGFSLSWSRISRDRRVGVVDRDEMLRASFFSCRRTFTYLEVNEQRMRSPQHSTFSAPLFFIRSNFASSPRFSFD